MSETTIERKTEIIIQCKGFCQNISYIDGKVTITVEQDGKIRGRIEFDRKCPRCGGPVKLLTPSFFSTLELGLVKRGKGEQ